MYGESETPVRVAAGLIQKGNQILICQRGINHRYGLKWEFPGGKLYPGERSDECLTRELEEELGIEPTEYKEIKTLQTSYSDGGNFQVTFFHVTNYTGTLKNNVFEQIAWVDIDRLEQYDLLEGSLAVIQFLPPIPPS